MTHATCRLDCDPFLFERDEFRPFAIHPLIPDRHLTEVLSIGLPLLDASRCAVADS
ncbi:hypothetical protein LCGC14_0642910, partial [marine sediment metagenome]